MGCQEGHKPNRDQEHHRECSHGCSGQRRGKLAATTPLRPAWRLLDRGHQQHEEPALTGMPTGLPRGAQQAAVSAAGDGVAAFFSLNTGMSPSV
jgi:hypothetical protein